MAERFHFDLTDGAATIADEDGVEASGIDHALGQALVAIKEMRESGELAELGGGWQMVVRDESDRVRHVIYLDEDSAVRPRYAAKM
ncbi:DUF6894 family protein [Methylobacterium oxalidis]|uniref:DUF6894 domain-containing protein n=1 Tax=Methylobacterium oxalidis TaxID=944322 RepID=A0A512JDL1_9HYPH|nr:hypothetical protein [Methylobacterium oxalidis]GEP08036.1 hypothetical protein MOX02_60740 [Methylobacterium oxalidis]GJE35920.1 hypothetical protein LDDCCGHA_6141 [Methylobacterium oxalidis]GLS66910.1 hypothetical protein GCM10007888_52930 [Methylobacterium oxalidis]